MLYVRLCLDAPGSLDLRIKHRPERQAYLDSGAINIVAGGPVCAGDSSDAYVGTFMLIEADSREEVVAYHENDPFTKVGIYERSFIMRFKKNIG